MSALIPVGGLALLVLAFCVYVLTQLGGVS